MIGFVIGTICLVGLVKMARRGACGYGGGCGYGGYGGGYGGYGGSCGGGSCGGGSCGHGGGWRGRWHGHHHGHHHGGGWGGPPWAREHGHDQHGGGGFGGPWMFQRAILRQLFERLETTPGQEKVIIAAVEEARTAGRKAWEALRDSREEVARSISGETFDEAAMGSAFAKQDEAIGEARRAMMNALTKVHEALDARQRAALSDILARGPRAWGRFGGPYRT